MRRLTKPHPAVRGSHWRKNRRGNSLVETALGFMVLMTLLFGVIDISMAVFMKSTLQHATREGARFGITYKTTYKGSACGCHEQCMQKVVLDQSFGFLNESNRNLVKVKFYFPDNLTTPRTDADLPYTLPDGRVVEYVNAPGNVVEVAVENYQWKWILPMPRALTGTGLSLSAYTSDVLQGLPVGMTEPPPW